MTEDTAAAQHSNDQLTAAVGREQRYMPFNRSSDAVLFYLPSKLYERTSNSITTNHRFSEWAQVFGDAKVDNSAP